jgi:hypothetical protein
MVARKPFPEDGRLLERLLELLAFVQDLYVVEPGEPVVGLEFNAALQQKLGIVIDEQPHAEDCEQAHRLYVMRCFLQEIATQFLRPIQLVFVEQARNGDEFRREN